jgi:hypothetical protein
MTYKRAHGRPQNKIIIGHENKFLALASARGGTLAKKVVPYQLRAIWDNDSSTVGLGSQ